MHPKLQSIVDVQPLLQEVIPDDGCFIVADTEVVVSYLPGERIDLKIPIGAQVEKFKGSVSYRALREGVHVQEERGPEQFGVSYISQAIPVFDDEQNIIGAFSLITSNEKYDVIRNSTSELAAMVEQLTATTDEVAQVSTEIAENVHSISSSVGQAVEQAERIDGVANFVKEIASQSNLLGLNAAIEASRAGDHGRGFAVVAQEIRKMADESKNATKEISNETNSIIRLIKGINEAMVYIATSTQQNAASIQELKAVFEHIAQTSEQLSTIAHASGRKGQ